MTRIFWMWIPFFTFRRDPMCSSAVLACFPSIRIPFWRLLVCVGQIRTIVCALSLRIKQLHHGSGDGTIGEFAPRQLRNGSSHDGSVDHPIVPKLEGCFTPIGFAHDTPCHRSKSAREETGGKVAALRDTKGSLGDPVGHGSGKLRKDPFGKVIEDSAYSLGNACRKHPYFLFNLLQWHASFLYPQTFSHGYYDISVSPHVTSNFSYSNLSRWRRGQGMEEVGPCLGSSGWSEVVKYGISPSRGFARPI